MLHLSSCPFQKGREGHILHFKYLSALCHLKPLDCFKYTVWMKLRLHLWGEEAVLLLFPDGNPEHQMLRPKSLIFETWHLNPYLDTRTAAWFKVVVTTSSCHWSYWICIRDWFSLVSKFTGKFINQLDQTLSILCFLFILSSAQEDQKQSKNLHCIHYLVKLLTHLQIMEK